MKAHIIQNGVVVNTIVVDSLDVLPNLVDGETGSIGWLYDGENLINPNPTPAPEPVETPRPLTRLEFETHVQSAAALTDAQFLAALNDGNLALLWHRLSIATQIERDNSLTQNGLSAMVAAGHLTEAQKTAVNDSWPE